MHFTDTLKSSSPNDAVALSLAMAIEAAVNEVISYSVDSKAYLLKIRTLGANLRRNEVLLSKPARILCTID